MKRYFVIVCVCAVALPGCQTKPADCDPTKRTGFLATAGCMSAYGKRQDQLAAEIEAERSLNQSLQDMLESIEAEKRAVAGQRRGQEAKMASLNRSWSSLKSSLDAKARKNQDLQRQVDKLQRKVDSVNAAQGMGDAEKQQRLDSLRRQVDLLMSELEAGMY